MKVKVKSCICVGVVVCI